MRPGQDAPFRIICSQLRTNPLGHSKQRVQESRVSLLASTEVEQWVACVPQRCARGPSAPRRGSIRGRHYQDLDHPGRIRLRRSALRGWSTTDCGMTPLSWSGAAKGLPRLDEDGVLAVGVHCTAPTTRRSRGRSDDSAGSPGPRRFRESRPDAQSLESPGPALGGPEDSGGTATEGGGTGFPQAGQSFAWN